MNTLSPPSEKRRPIPPLVWAGAGTLALHGVLLLVLLLWPRPPVKAREQLLEVDLTKPKTPKVVLQPTAHPTAAPHPTPAPRPTTAPPPTPAPRPTVPPPPRPRAIIVPKTRVAKIIPTSVPPKVVPTAAPTTKPPVVPTSPPVKPTAVPTPPPVKPTAMPTRPSSARANAPAKTSTKSGSPQSSTPAKKPSKSPGSRSGGSNPAPPNLNPAHTRPSGGSSGRLFARNPGPIEEPDNRKSPTEASDNAKRGSNNRGHSDETAESEPNVDLPRTRARRGRGNSMDKAVSSAPVSTKDGEEVNIGASSPGPSSHGRPRVAMNAGDGDEATGAQRSGGIANATGKTNLGSDRSGRGADEAPGEGISNGRSGSGSRGNSRRGRGGSHLTGDPFGTGGGNGGYGKEKGDGGDGGTGKGPAGGTRLARRGQGDGDGDSDGDGSYGRGKGTGSGRDPGSGSGPGGRGGDGGGPGNGRGDEDSIGDATTGTGRSRRGHGSHREGDTEDEIGRGIWGGFKLAFYQDKARYPDDKDIRTLEGKPIDWSVFSGRPQSKTVPNLDFDWGATPPMGGMKATYWSMKASGTLFVPKDDDYHFYLDNLDDGGRLYLDGERIIDIWQIQKSTPTSEVKHLTRGKHDIKIEYVQGPPTEASISLSWSSTSFGKEIIGVYKPAGSG